MSEKTEKTEIVRAVYERWSRGDFAAGVERYDPNVLLVLNPEFPDSGTYLGLEEIGAYMRGQFLSDLHDVGITGEEFIEAGDSVVVRVNQIATGPESGVRVPIVYYQAWTFRGDAVIRIESIREREDALAAVGLEPER